MTDVVEIAKEHQARLATEIGKLNDFIRMAEELVKDTRHSRWRLDRVQAVGSVDQ